MKLQTDTGYDVQKQRTIITAVLRLVFSLTSLVETSEFFEVSLFSLEKTSLLSFGLLMQLSSSDFVS